MQGSTCSYLGVSIFAFDNIMSDLGGFSAFMWMIVGFSVTNYQNFRYQNTIVKQMYTNKKNSLTRFKNQKLNGDSFKHDDDITDYEAMVDTLN